MKNLVAFLTVCVLSCPTVADTWTVDDDGKADFDNIYFAVAAASDGDVILVMGGTYYSSYINPHGKNILVEGETNSKGELLVTVDGMQSGAILECYSGEGPGTVFRNLILTNGSSYYGGGMTLFDGSSPTVENCIFRNNTGTIEGGAIYLRENCNPIIINCRFEDNIASGPGGGIFCMENSNPTIENCAFINNSAYNGGGMYNYDNSIPTLTDTTVCGNTPDQINGDWTDNGGNTIADECPECPDINGDGDVDVSDLLSIIDQWGLANSPADVNQDGIVDVTDLLEVVSKWGTCE
jgi:parallel beta-helix repeat protein